MPRSTILPCCSTMISSQSRIVLRRWAMMMQVQPRRRRLSSIAFSVIGSSAPVASSSTSTDGLADQRAGDLDALALAAAEIGAALVDMAIVVAGAGRDIVVDRGVLERARQIELRRSCDPTASDCRARFLRTGRCPGRHRRSSWRGRRAGYPAAVPSMRISPAQGL